VPRSLSIKLDVAVVLPLLELLRAQVAALIESNGRMSGQTDLTDEPRSLSKRTQTQIALLEVQELMALFGWDFPKTGTVCIGEDAAPKLLRACAFLRLDLRQRNLSTLSDATLESGFDGVDRLKENNTLMCYLFLATTQEIILQNFSLSKIRTSFSLNALWTPIRNYFSRRTSGATVAPGPIEAYQVVVHNDPVNIMTYVAMVFQRVLGLPADVAQTRMCEVHELKRSVVWEGPRAMAEAHATSLQAWHLTAVAQPVPGRHPANV
jgi:ATP-dependent Clp protease adaptor protein ClpS